MFDEIGGAGCLRARAEHRDDAAGHQRSHDVPDRVLGLGRPNALEARLLPQDRRVQTLELRARFDPEFVHERPTRVLVGLERLRLTP